MSADQAPQVVYEPPCVELGLALEGGVHVVCTPMFTRHDHEHDPHAVLGAGAAGSKAGASAAASSSHGFELRLDAATVNVDELLLRAAAELATHELELVKERLERAMAEAQMSHMAQLHLHHAPLFWTPLAAAAASELTVATAAADNAPSASAMGAGISSNSSRPYEVVVPSPVLEIWSEGLLMLRVSRNLLTGRVRIQPGPGGGSDAIFEHLTSYMAKEEEINTALHAVHNQPIAETSATAAASGGSANTAGTGGTAGSSMIGQHQQGTVKARVLDELVQRLAKLLRQEYRAMINSRILCAARQLQLQSGGVAGRSIIKDPSIPAAAWASLRRHMYMFSFPPVPFPSDFPLLHPLPGQYASPNLSPRGLIFSLGADLESTHHRVPSYSLLVGSATDRMVPVCLLKIITVPPHVYAHTLPQLPPSPTSGLEGGEQGAGEADGRGAAAGASGHHSLAQTMAAQHASYALLAAVVQWCHRRIVWEILTVQLKALGAEFVETVVDGHHILRLSKASGVDIPCRVSRRPGLSPGHVGVTSVVLHLNQDGQSASHATQGHTVPGLAGVTGSAGQQGIDPASIEASGRGQFEAVVRGQFFANTDSIAGCSASGGSGAGGGGGAMLRASHVQQAGLGVLRLQYSLSSGHTVLDVLSDIASILRMQTFLARLEGMALQGQQLEVQGAQEEEELTLPALLGTAAASGAGAGDQMEIDQSDGRAAKRSRIAGMPDANHVTAMANGGHSNGPVTAQQSDVPGSMHWQWECNGSVHLSHYTPTAALLRYQAPASTSTSSFPATSQPPLHLSLHVSWQKAAPPAGSAGKRTAPTALSPPRLPELVCCCVSEVQQAEGLSDDALAPIAASSSSALSSQLPVVSLLKEIGSMADAGDEGMLLDTLQIAAWPMHQIQAAAAALRAPAGSGSETLVSGLAHIADGAPFRHKLLARLAKPSSGGPLPGSLGAGSNLSLEFAAMAVGRTWVRLRFAGSGGGGASSVSDHMAADGELLQSVASQLQLQLGSEVVHVAHAWSAIASVPSGWPGQPAESKARQLWFLVSNAQLRAAVELVLRIAGAGAMSVKKQEL